jgi:hypothetical protein
MALIGNSGFNNLPKSGTAQRGSSSKPAIKSSTQNSSQAQASNSTDTPKEDSSKTQESKNQYAFSTWATTLNPNQIAEKFNQFSGAEWQRMTRESQAGFMQAQGLMESWKIASAGIQSIVSGVGKIATAMEKAKQQGGGGGGGDGERGVNPGQSSNETRLVDNRRNLDLFNRNS